MKTLSALFLFAVLLFPPSLFAANEDSDSRRQPIRVQGMNTLYSPQNGITDRASAEYDRPLAGGLLRGTSRVSRDARPSARSIDKKSKEWKNGIRSSREDHFENIGIPQRRHRSRFKRESAYQRKPASSPTAE